MGASMRTGTGMSEPVWFRRTGFVAAGALGGAWLVVLGMILRHRIFVSSDTVSNYAHVWYVSRVLVDSHRIPYHMSIIGHGRGLAFPYAFIPWLSAALLRPLLGDWVVTLWLVIGSVGLVVATFWAFPELRRGWWAALVLANPVLIVALVLGQLPFVWAMAMLLAAVACWRAGGRRVGDRARRSRAGDPRGRRAPDRGHARRRLAALGARPTPAAPRVRGVARHRRAAVWLVFLTPAYTDSSLGVKVVNFVETVARACSSSCSRSRLCSCGASCVRGCRRSCSRSASP